MARFKGTVSRNDLEGGFLQLIDAKGLRLVLEGIVDGEWVGKRVVIEGSIDRESLSFSMSGPRLVVQSIAGDE
ncbi:MAG: hypothetical protein SGI86_05985 [Deltaproteobacteria bacterium]|nr:hypothetical protein [Deltaproteobacteria bacterium]